MAKWKSAGAMAVAMREAEKQAELKRMQEEQWQESVKNGTMLRQHARRRAGACRNANAAFLQDEKMFRVLHQEHETRQWDLHVASSRYFRRQDAKNRRTVIHNIVATERAQEEARRLKDAIHVANRKSKEMDMEIKAKQKELKILKRQLDNVHVVAPEKVAKRQETAHYYLGLQLAENEKLKKQVAHLEMEKLKVQTILKGLKKDSEYLSKQLFEHAEVSKTTYEQRDLNKLNINKLKDHLEKSTASYLSDMQLLQFQIDCLRRMERFMCTKNKFRLDEGKERRREHQSQLSCTEKDRKILSATMDHICRDIGESDMRVIIRTFIELQEENYMLFRNISETRDSANNMQIEIEKTKEEIDAYRDTNKNREQELLAHSMQLREKIEHCGREAEQKEGYIAQAEQVIKTYIEGILSILDKLGYTEEDVLRLAGVFKCVEERNVRQFLAELEHFVNLLDTLKMTADYMEFDRIRKLENLNQPPEPLPPRLALVHRVMVVPPVHDEDEQDDHPLSGDAAFRPLDREELEECVDEDLEVQVQEDELRIPSPTMADAASEAIGDSPQSPPPKAGTDIF